MEQPYIPSEQSLPELTLKAVILSIILAAILAASNAYVGLKVGLTVSASIPAAMVAMVLFRFSKRSNILENNVVQTGASASAAIASGIVFVIPALLITKFWTHINYLETIFICLAGGILGVLFSIPLRRALLSHSELRYPEGRAIAEVLKVGESSASLRELFYGSFLGAAVQFCQQGLQLFASDYPLWFKAGPTILGLGTGFDITMLGAGYIVGFSAGLSMILGSVIGWVLGIPILSLLNHHHLPPGDTSSVVMQLWSSKIRYMGIGAMLVGGLWSLILSAKPILISLKLAFTNSKTNHSSHFSRTEFDIPIKYAAFIVITLLAALLFYVYYQLQHLNLGFTFHTSLLFLLITLLYFLVSGFIFSALCAYFSGLIGMSASPVSAINIAAVIVISLILNLFLTTNHLSGTDIATHAVALCILITAIVACAASMANNTIQDLKTGELLGATPWKLQVMLIIGTFISILVIPPVVELLFYTYGIGGVFPHAGMNASQVLGAPQASLIAAVAQGAFFHNLPFGLIITGAIILTIIIIANYFLTLVGQRLSVVALAVGIYLPMIITVPIFIGSFVSLLIYRRHHRQAQLQDKTVKQTLAQKQSAILIACGLVAGGSIVGVLLSVPFAIYGNTNLLAVVGPNFAFKGFMLSVIVTYLICWFIYRSGTKA